MNRFITVCFGIICIMSLCSAARLTDKRPGVTVSPQKLQLFVDQQTDPYTIKIAYTLHIPPHYIHSCARLIYRPYFLTPGHRYDLPTLVISGRENIRQEKRLEELNGNYREIPNAIYLKAEKDSMQIELSDTIPFQVWMAQSKLQADIILEACDREKETATLILADGAIWFPEGPGPELVSTPEAIQYTKDTVTTEKVAVFKFYYPLAQDFYAPEYVGNVERMQAMKDLINSLRNNPDMKLNKIVITGSSSPIGNMNFNAWLAGQRALSIKQQLEESKLLPPEHIVVNMINEDWTGLRKLVSDSDLPDKTTILRIINRNYNDAERNRLLQALPQYKYIRLNMYPDLQKVTCIFYYTQRQEETKIVPQ